MWGDSHGRGARLAGLDSQPSQAEFAIILKNNRIEQSLSEYYLSFFVYIFQSLNAPGCLSR